MSRDNQPDKRVETTQMYYFLNKKHTDKNIILSVTQIIYLSTTLVIVLKFLPEIPIQLWVYKENNHCISMAFLSVIELFIT